MAKRGTTNTSVDENRMNHGVINGFMGSWNSGLAYLIIDGQPVPCDNGATVRSLEACFGRVIAPGHVVNQETIVGKEIHYSVGLWGVLESFSPIDSDEGSQKRVVSRRGSMTWAEAQLGGCITEALFAQKKLNGDTTIHGPDDHDAPQAIVSQGRRAEGLLRREGSIEYIRGAYERTGMEYVEEGSG